MFMNISSIASGLNLFALKKLEGVFIPIRSTYCSISSSGEKHIFLSKSIQYAWKPSKYTHYIIEPPLMLKNTQMNLKPKPSWYHSLNPYPSKAPHNQLMTLKAIQVWLKPSYITTS